MLWYLKNHGFPSLRKMEKFSIMEVDRHRDNKAVNISISMEGLVDKITNQNFVPVVDDNNVTLFIGLYSNDDAGCCVGVILD